MEEVSTIYLTWSISSFIHFASSALRMWSNFHSFYPLLDSENTMKLSGGIGSQGILHREITAGMVGGKGAQG
jgi:hypothetical protein